MKVWSSGEKHQAASLFLVPCYICILEQLWLTLHCSYVCPLAANINIFSEIKYLVTNFKKDSSSPYQLGHTGYKSHIAEPLASDLVHVLEQCVSHMAAASLYREILARGHLRQVTCTARTKCRRWKWSSDSLRTAVPGPWSWYSGLPLMY